MTQYALKTRVSVRGSRRARPHIRIVWKNHGSNDLHAVMTDSFKKANQYVVDVLLSNRSNVIEKAVEVMPDGKEVPLLVDTYFGMVRRSR